MLKKFVVAFLITCSLFTALHTPAKAQTATIRFYAFGDPGEEAAYKSLVDAFNKKDPALQASLVFTDGEDEFSGAEESDDYRLRLTTALAGGQPPDVFMFTYRELGVFSSKGVLENVGPYLEKSKAFKKDDFYPQALKPFTTTDGALQCLPQNASPLVVYYNKALFDKAKLKYPANDWTYDEFLKDAQALTTNLDKPQEAQYGAGVKVGIANMLPFLWINGGSFVDNDAAPTKFTLDTPEGKAGLQAFLDLQNKYKVVPDETAVRARTPADRFLAGTEGMILFSRRLTPTLRKASFDWDVAPFPKGKAQATLLFSDGYCMTKAGQKDNAWKFIEFAAGTEGQTLLARTGRSVPSLKAVAESPVFLDTTAKPANSKIFIDGLAYSRFAPYSASWGEAEEQVNEPLEEGFYDGHDVDEVIEEIEDHATAALKAK